MDSAYETLQGAELIRIGIETYSIRLEFSGDTFDIGGDFTLADEHGNVELFRPGKQVGAVQLLWKLIGDTIAEVRWTDPIWSSEISLKFSSGLAIVVLTRATPQGTLHHHHAGGRIMLDDF